MSKGILEFDLITEREEFETAQNGWKYKCVVDDLFAFIRTKTKYDDETSISFEDLRDKIVEICKDNEVEL